MSPRYQEIQSLGSVALCGHDNHLSTAVERSLHDDMNCHVRADTKLVFVAPRIQSNVSARLQGNVAVENLACVTSEKESNVTA